MSSMGGRWWTGYWERTGVEGPFLNIAVREKYSGPPINKLWVWRSWGTG